MSDLVLHGFYGSGTSYRTRIALNVKGVPYRQEPVDLRSGGQKSDRFLALNPQGLVPALECDDGVLTQSSAIIEWLDERYPDPPLLPPNRADRAVARSMAMAVACDIHPLNNLRVRKYLQHEYGQDAAGIDAWSQTWIRAGFDALEVMIDRHGGRFAFGDTLTTVDCHLVPQVYSAERFNVDCSPWPELMRVVGNARAEPAVAAAHPDVQPDAP
ncbi:maleylacetoacetate isomerase [Tsuneonella sp. HG222]